MSDSCQHCHCDHPEPAAPTAERDAPGAEGLSRRETRFRIEQMDCPTEERLLRKALEGMPGVRSLSFDLIGRTLKVGHDLDDVQPIQAAISALNMSPVLLDAAAPAADQAEEAVASRPPWLRMGAAGVLAIAAEALAYATGTDRSLPVVALALGSILLCGLGTLRKGWLALRHFTLNINLLMTVAVIGAAVLGQWPEAAMVIWLFGLAETIEAMSLTRARHAIRSLTALAPERGSVRQADGAWLDLPAGQIGMGAVVRARPGERIVLDGEVVAGSSSVDQSPITGESMPADKQSGDPVYAGTVNQQGVLEYRVTAAAGHTMLDRIAHTIQEAQGKRAPTQRFIDRFAAVYTPAVFAVAIAVALGGPLLLGMTWLDAVYRALVLLVIACPCALVISTPVTIVSGLASAARRGILVKGGLYLEQGRHLRHLALDKTGTLTHGKPVLTDVVPLGASPASRAQALQWAASLEALSPHPVAHAVVSAHTGQVLDVADYRALPGRGVAGRMQGQDYSLGSLRLAGELGAATPELEAEMQALEAQGKTTMILCQGPRAVALLAVADTIRDTSRAAIADLRRLGVEPVILSGDNTATVRTVGADLGIADARGGLLPEDKLAAIEALGGQGPVGMVGDGVNDAPALARADIGFAMGAAGTDTAIETADVALMQDDLRKLPEFIRLSRRTAGVLWQNIVFALGIKLVFFALTFAGEATLWMAVFADAGASLLVVFNGLRLLRAAPSRHPEQAPAQLRGSAA
ncbi:putative cadmium-transporting ATPase [Pigmentiphaga humi]|uniref:P-type Zn(2+) transporter n=1 Tax=Pigmentiphaga humi TaxID=2478468 RepID=A0A3P4B8F6_9BURK|nr:heavy metal translocating P-type ATPase [Pigmentiphaga humi]VCU72513.1 putative cadmium-transporting ATPase [Pigmentiphaga humi]